MATFYTNCTVPSGNFNYVTAPNTRGTLQILWSCLGTLFLCTWTVQHLNVPQQSVPQTRTQSLRRRTWRFITKVKWMFLTLLAPELVLGKAYSDFCSASKHHAEYKRVAENDGVVWSISHTFLANMGGFAIVFDDEAEGRLSTTSDSALPADNNALTGPQFVRQDLRTQGHSSAQQSSSDVRGSLRRPSQASPPNPNSSQVQEHDAEADDDNTAPSEDAAFPHPTSTPLTVVGEPEITSDHNARSDQGHSRNQKRQVSSVLSGDRRLREPPLPRCAVKSDPSQVQEHDAEADDDNIAPSEDAAFPHPTSTPLTVAGEPEITSDHNTRSDQGHPRNQKSQVSSVLSSDRRLREPPLPRCAVKPDQKNPPVNIDLQTQIQNFLRELSQSGYFGLQASARSETADSRAIGSTNWTPDTRNTRLVNSALDEMQLKDFPTAWEKIRYLRMHKTWYTNLSALQGNIWCLDACQLLLARKMGIIDKLPSVSEDEVDDRNKGDFLVKGLAVGQVLWLFVQLIARVAKALVPSQLEVVVLAFSIFTFVTYLLLWSKPQDVKTPSYVRACRYSSMEELSRVSMYGPQKFYPYGSWHRISNSSLHCDGSGARAVGQKFAYASALGVIVFGSLHCLAWNLHFPTPVERLLWRIAAVITAGATPVGAVALVSLHGSLRYVLKEDPYFLEILTAIINCLAVAFIGIPYFLARVYITVEIFRSLFFLDPETFLTTWSVNIPHLS